MRFQSSSQNFARLLTGAATALLALTSLLGLLAPAWTYPAPDRARAFVPNDAANLVLLLPFLLVVTASPWRGAAWANLARPGALLAAAYNSLIVLITLRPGLVAGLHFVQVAVCLAAAALLLHRLTGDIAAPGMRSGLLEKLTGGVLAGMGLLFFGRAAALMSAAGEAAFFGSVEFGVTLADLVFSIAWMVFGVGAWQGKPFGLAGAAAGVTQMGLLFVGLMIVMALQPLLSGTPLAAGDLIVIAAMSLVVLVPGGLYVAKLDQILSKEISFKK